MTQAYFGAGPSEDPSETFERGFGGALTITKDSFGGSSALYYDPWNKIDERSAICKTMMEKEFKNMQTLEKQSIDTQTGGAGTAGTALIPVYVDPQVVDRTRRMTPLTEITPRRAVRGSTYDYIPLTAKAGAQFNFEDAALADQVDTYDRVSVAIKFLYAVGRVTGPSIAAMRGFIDPSQLDLAVKTQSIKELEEETIINGDLTTNSEEFDGFIQIISTNTTAVSGNVTLAGIRAELATTFNANGMVTLAVTDASTHNFIKGLLQDFQRQPAPPAENLPFGIPGAFSFDGVDFIKNRFMPTTSTSRRILLLDQRYYFMAVLQDVTFEELAKTNDSNKYMLKEYIALVVTFEAAMSQMTTIT